MAAGLGFKDFATGEVLTAADVDGYLMQGIWVFASAAARDAAVTSPQEGNACYLKDTNQVLTYSGSAWVAVGGGSPLTTKGDLYTFSTVDARLGVGANGTTLVADSSESTGLKWAAPASGALTLISSTTFSSSSSHSVNDVFSSTYDNYLIIPNIDSISTGSYIRMRLRVSGSDNTSSNYYFSLFANHSSDGTLSTDISNGTATSWAIMYQESTGFETGSQLFLANPFLTKRTSGSNLLNAIRSSDTTNGKTGLGTSVNTSYTGFTIFPASGNMTGGVRVYGYQNS